MDKKIAIVTWYTNGNHGGTLQAYALQKVLKNLGHESEFVNYSPQKKIIKYKVKRFFKDLAIDIFKPKVGKTRKAIYQFVKDEMDVSKEYTSYDTLTNEAETNYFAAICGSDQIWANVGNKIAEINYLTFIDKNKRISYAPSTGYNRIDEKIKGNFIELVKQIRFLSVREKQGADFVYDVTGCQAKVMLDPSLLLDKKQWENKIESRKKANKNTTKYIFAYFLGGNEKHTEFVYKLSESTGLPIISIDQKNSKFKESDKVVVDPLEFLELIKNAEYVLTDSFHGAALSINLEKQFVVFKRFKDTDPNNQNSRIINILDKTNLQERLIKEESSIDYILNNQIDYSESRLLLEAERKKSIEYLQKSIDIIQAEELVGN